MPDNISGSTNPKIRKPMGGKRAESGRKPNYLKRLGIKAITTAERPRSIPTLAP
jgi:hypothetical protein